MSNCRSTGGMEIWPSSAGHGPVPRVQSQIFIYPPSWARPFPDQRPLQKCLQDVAHCDLYVGIFAWRYGYIPSENNPDARSITELELREAMNVGIECLLFLHDEKAGWPQELKLRAQGSHE